MPNSVYHMMVSAKRNLAGYEIDIYWKLFRRPLFESFPLSKGEVSSPGLQVAHNFSFYYNIRKPLLNVFSGLACSTFFSIR